MTSIQQTVLRCMALSPLRPATLRALLSVFMAGVLLLTSALPALGALRQGQSNQHRLG